MANVPVLLLLLFSTLFLSEHCCLRTFHLIQKNMNQPEARAACRANYTDLVTVYSEGDNTALINLTETLPAGSTVWIGLQRNRFFSKWSNADNIAPFQRMSFCAAMETNGSWTILQCTETKIFMCQKTDVTSITYHLINKSLNWYDAQGYCRRNYTDLVSIGNKDQNEAVKIKGMTSNTSFWIGLLLDDWEWADGGHSAYRKWVAYQPRSPSTLSDCVQLKNKDWETVPCRNNVSAALCYSTSSNVSDDSINRKSTPDYSKTVFSSAEQSHLRTFHLIEKNMTQTEARAACRVNYTDLVTVYDVEDITALIKLTGIGSAWTGLYRNQSSTKWSNGDEITFSALTENCGSGIWCAAMKADGSWENLQCTETRSFMCYKQDETDLTFSYHLITQNLTWYEAQSYCRRNYTDLVSIRDQNQNEAVKIKGVNSCTSFWIGLLRDDWEWADGGHSAYRNWWDGQPGPFPSDCVKLISGKLYSVPCSNTGSALCYNMSIHVSDDPMSWESALDYCKKDNRNGLLRIESDLEQKLLESELRKRRVSGLLWVGLGETRTSELLKSYSKLALGPWTNWNGVRPSSPSCGAMDNVESSFRVKTDVSELRAVCALKQP